MPLIQTESDVMSRSFVILFHCSKMTETKNWFNTAH